MSYDLVVIGQGYVGLPVSQYAAMSGLSVVGLELNRETVENLNKGISHIGDISDSELSEMLAAGYRASSDAEVLSAARTIVICVPTPLGDAGSPDLSAVESAVRSLAPRLSPGALVVLESTTYPGTTDDIVLPIIEAAGKSLDSDFFLAFSPERIDPGNEKYGLKNTPKVVGGVSAESTRRAVDFYSRFVDTVVPVKGAREAETAKLLENTYRHINIALVNEMAKFCHELDIDLWDVIDAAKTKPFGFQAFYPGPGVGGHCIPIDPNYLSYQVRKQLKYPFRFVELAEEINNSMPGYIVRRVQELLNVDSRSLRGSSILLLGVTYKANVADQRESPATEIAEILERGGAEVRYHDPFVSKWEYANTSLISETDYDQAVKKADVVILLQAHTEYDVDALAATSIRFFDTRGGARGAGAHRL
ncbi:nucleotide sugar dehydrogenase [Arthrobacter globiformis]|uniref:nucleotide sugar dehydrogenase n=1 Tax=Arthrobacter globiformis TaxID=1665 RepID=UPI0027898335|nr:nucleotide sugar dehydrogenase [Arthrobacter globiformis]MDQ0865809.1 UDP-N-acetyl-D-glucosamine dehydrogenase [Arthrobacter globiformis]